MAVKAVFFDIDGTLLTDNRTVSKSTIQAINALKKNGIFVGLATGRDPNFVLKYMAGLSLDLAITYNGQYIFSRDQVHFAQALDRGTLETFLELVESNQWDYSLGLGTGVVGSGIMNVGTGHLVYRLTRMIPISWASGINFLINRLVRKFRPKDTDKIHSYLDQPVYQVLLLATESVTQRLALQFPTLGFTRSSAYGADVISKGNSKLQGIQKLGEIYGFDTEEVMVFGDSNNDLEMLAGVQYAIAMGNATQQAKGTATYVTDTNNKDGIYKALVHFGLVEEKNVD